MKKYRVCLNVPSSHYVVVEVEANNKKEAKAKAKEAGFEHDDLPWEYNGMDRYKITAGKAVLADSEVK